VVTGKRIGQVLATAAVGLSLLAGTSSLAGAATAAPPAPTAARTVSPAACADPSTAFAHWWMDFGWPRSSSNKEYSVESPSGGGNKVYIWGGETYKNVSSPKLPAGTYNSYDTVFLPTASSPRQAGRLVREANTHVVYYTPNHYASWCNMGIW
jgi:guanyl-specific ribonuclease Sa